MKFCPECGSKITDLMKFCPSCGTDLNAQRELEAKRRAEESVQAAAVQPAGESVSETVPSEPEVQPDIPFSEAVQPEADVFPQQEIPPVPAKPKVPMFSFSPMGPVKSEAPAVPSAPEPDKPAEPAIPAFPEQQELPAVPEEQPVPAAFSEETDDPFMKFFSVPDQTPEAVPAASEPDGSEEPDAQEIPAEPEVPEVPEAPPAPEKPKFPVFSFSPMGFAKTDLPAVPEFPSVPEETEITEVPQVPAVSDEAVIPEIPDIPTDPEEPEIPVVPEFPAIAENAEDTTGPDVPDETEITDVPVFPVIAEAAAVPGISEEPEIAEIPAVPEDIPEDIPSVPDVIPAVPEEIPAIPDEVTDIPVIPEEPQESEEPEPPAEPEPAPAAAGCAAYRPVYKEAIRRARDHFYYADARFALPGGSFAFSDDLSGELDAMLDIQLTDADLWAKFVELFKHPGVDDEDCGWRCEYWGKMMRGACFTYAALPASAAETADCLYAVLEATVRDLLTAQDEYGRFSTYSVDAEFRGWDIWGRKYVLLGMIYFLDICRDDRLADEIVDALKRHTDYMISKLGTPEEGKRLIAACSNNWDGLNSCSLLEPVMLLYNITHEPRYFDFAEYILSFGGTLHQNLFELAWEDEVSIADYSITKAYEMISCFEGLAEYAKLTGNSFAREAVVRFADRVLREEETVIGCLGCEYESFDKSAVEQFDENRTGIMQETCVTVTWMKFCWQLWRMTGEDKWIDALERSAYNAMSAALRRHIDPEANGGVAIPIHSYNPLRHDVRSDLMGGRKTITQDSCYGCCVCISSAGFALDTLAAAGVDRKGTIYLNLYRSGTLTVGDFTLRIDTDYPKSGEIRFAADGFEGERTLVLRIPAWASEASLTTGGVSVGCEGPNHTLTVTPGAVFTLNLGMPVTVVTPEEASHGLAECDKYLAVERGPVVFALDECEEEEPVVPVDEARVNDWGEGKPVSPEDAPVPCRQAVRIPLLNRSSVTLVDYASAGQESGHKVCAWLRVR